MRFIHCADIHLDSALETNLSSEQAKKRRAELLESFLRMLDYASEAEVSGILICGDLFDGNRVRKDTLETVRHAIESHPEITFFYLRGNHDADSVLGKEHLPNLCTFTDVPTSYQIRNVNILGMELTGANAGLLENLRVPNKECVNIVMLHGQESRYKKDGEIVPISALKNHSIDYLALGHIHSYREERLDSAGVYCYSGCLEPRGFDEPGEKGFVLLDVNEERNTINREFIAFSRRTLYEVYVDISDCMNTGEVRTKLEQSLEMCEATTEDMVKVILTGAVELRMELDVELLKAALSGRFFASKLVVDTEYRIRPEEFQYDTSLSGEFVRLVLGDSELSEEDRNAILHMGLRVLSGEKIV